MSCNKKLKIVAGDNKNLKIIISKDTSPVDCTLRSDISGTISSIPVTVKNSSIIIPGNGHAILEDAANNQQTIAYTSVTDLTSKTYTLNTASTILSYNFYEGYDCILDGGRVDITSDTFKFEAKDIDGNIMISKTGTILDGSAGLAVIELLPSDTNIAIGEYYYSIEWTTSSGSVSTLVTAILEIRQDIIT